MKKIAIITITNSGMNYGNRLQNYALQHVLEGCSAQVQTIYSAKSLFNSLILSKLRRLAKALLKSSSRRRSFNSFDNKYIKKAKRVRYEGLNDHTFNNDFDAFIAGSDQVWNPNFHFNSGFEFMTFADPPKRYSYSASFGVSEIPEHHRQEYAERLKQMQGISVREEQGREIVKQLSDRDAEVHIDPTMLLDAEHYVGMEEKPEHPLPDKYLLTYFFGEKTPEYIAFLSDVAERLGLHVLELSDLPGTPFYNLGPQHFLYLIRHADYFCTDSFHAAVFSILFHKPFTVFYRRDDNVPMSSRIDTLLDKVNLKERLFGALSVEDSMKHIPYDEVDERLFREREAAFKYLREIVER